MAPHDDLPDLPPPSRDSGAEWNVDAMWGRVRARTVDSDAERPAPRSAGGWRSPSRQWAILAGAAAVLLVVFAGVARVLRPPAVLAPVASTVARPERAQHYATARGQTSTIRLTDGSEVTLAPESQLAVMARFANGSRTVILNGEAIFSVRHDSLRPFIVRARGAVISDIGTRFDLRAYPGERTVSVAVAEGAVSMARGDASGAVVLHANDVGTLGERAAISVESGGRVGDVMAWSAGSLSFRNRPLAEVLQTIGRWYDLDVRAPDPKLANRRVTAQFTKQSSEEILDAVALAVDATVERAGRVVTLRPR